MVTLTCAGSAVVATAFRLALGMIFFLAGVLKLGQRSDLQSVVRALGLRPLECSALGFEYFHWSRCLSACG